VWKPPAADVRKLLLACGILSAVAYAAANIIVPTQWDAYNWTSQTVSELSAIGAPTRALWIALVIPYGVLLIAFGAGVSLSADHHRGLTIAGVLIVVDGVIGFTWPPMHLREVLAAGGGTFTDTMHIAYTAINAVLMFAAIGFSMTAFGSRYRAYCVATVIVELAFGIVTGIQSANMQANLPTPWLGVWERIIIAAMIAWPVVLAIALLRRPMESSKRPAVLVYQR
jgi:hypothetical protein